MAMWWWRAGAEHSPPAWLVMSGFFACTLLVRPCMRIISPLLTVAIVAYIGEGGITRPQGRRCDASLKPSLAAC